MFNSAVVEVTPSSMFNSAAVEVTPSKMFNSAVVLVTPSKMFNSAVVLVTPSRILISAVVEVTPSIILSSVEVEDITTSSFIFGEFNLLFVSIEVPLSTNAFTLCCDGGKIAESDPIASSSTTGIAGLT